MAMKEEVHMGARSQAIGVLTLIFLLMVAFQVGVSLSDPLAGSGLSVGPPQEELGGATAHDFRSAMIIEEYEGKHSRGETGLDFHYNRVDGPFLQLGLDTEWKSPAKLRFSAWAGYAFKAKAWRYEIGLIRWLDLGSNRLEMAVRNYDLTATEDEWLMPTLENTLAALFFREDFRDYHRRTGTSFHLIHTSFQRFNMELGCRLDKHESLRKKTNWSVFGGDKKFRENPEVEEKTINSIEARVGYDTRDDFIEPSSGFLIQVAYEKAGDDVGGDMAFQRLLLELRRYLYLSAFENIDLRLRLGTTAGDVPVQKTFDLGGIGSLRGYKFKEYRDFDRVILGNVEYRIKFGRLAADFLQDKQIIPFYDFGLAWRNKGTNSLTSGFDQLRLDGLKTAVGIGLSLGASDEFRINLSRRLDDRDRSMVLTVRINRMF
jgi:hypothetical protein